MTTQRNDPCPCGSGQKYKKCCMRTEQARAGLERSKTDVTEVVKPETIPYAWQKVWNAARARGDYGLLYDLTLDGGPYRGRFATREEFYLHAQGNPLPGGADWRLKKVKLDEQRAYLLSSRGEGDQRAEYVEAELLTLGRTPEGWRLADAASARRPVDEADELFVGFASFGVENIEDPWRQRVQDGWERPDLADRPAEEGDEAAGEAGASRPSDGEESAGPTADAVSEAMVEGTTAESDVTGAPAEEP